MAKKDSCRSAEALQRLPTGARLSSHESTAAAAAAEEEEPAHPAKVVEGREGKQAWGGALAALAAPALAGLHACRPAGGVLVRSGARQDQAPLLPRRRAGLRGCRQFPPPACRRTGFGVARRRAGAAALLAVTQDCRQAAALLAREPRLQLLL